MAAVENTDTLKTPKEFGEMFKKSKSRVHQLIEKGDIKPIKIGSQYFIDLSKYPNWIW